MKYEIITHEIMDLTQTHILIDREDGSFESFPADESNPRYQQFVLELDES
jgi:hypothetical protein